MERNHSSLDVAAMKKLLILLLLQGEVLSKLLVTKTGINCSGSSSIGPNAVTAKFFEDQHTLAMIDYSTIKVVSSEICAEGKISKAFAVYDDLKKMNLVTQIHRSGLSEYSRTLGMYVKGTFKKFISISPQIAKINPRSKLMIQITDGSYGNAEKILHEAFHKHKMLNVGVMMFIHQSYAMTFCMYNPFMPEFKCWNMTSINYKESIQPIADYIGERIKNFHNYPLKVAAYRHSVLAMPIKNKDGIVSHYDYPDGNLIQEFAGKLNFKLIYFHTGGDIRQGYQLPNGSFTGNLGLIETDVADYSANSLLISSSYNTSNTLFVNSMAMEQFVFIIKKRQPIMDYGLLMFMEFDATSRKILIGLTILFPFLYILIAKLESKVLRSQKKTEIIKSIFYIIALHFNISMKHSKRLATRMMIASILFFALITNSIFQGTIVSSLNSLQYDGKIKTMDDLDANNYRIVIHSDVKAVLDGLGGRWKNVTLDPKSIVMNVTEGIEEVRKHSDVAFLISTLFTGSFLNRFYDKVTSENVIEAVPEIIFEFYTSPLIPKNSPFVEQFKEFSMRYLESGIREYQLSRADSENAKVMTQRLLAGQVPKQKDKTIELIDLRSIIRVYLTLNVIAFFLFLAELIWKHLAAKLCKTEPPFEFVL